VSVAKERVLKKYLNDIPLGRFNFEQVLEIIALSYPMLYPNRHEILVSLFFVIGNGYFWKKNGTLGTDDDEDCSVQKAVIAFEQGAKAQWAGQGVRQIYPFSSEEEGSSLINEIPDNVRTDYLRGAWEALHLALTHLPLDKRQEDTLEQAKIMKEKMQARFGEMPAFEHVLYIAPNEQEMNKRWAEEEIKFNEKIEALKKST
jgi:hypothetical protein